LYATSRSPDKAELETLRDGIDHIIMEAGYEGEIIVLQLQDLLIEADAARCLAEREED